MSIHLSTTSWRIKLLAALALVHDASCHHNNARTDVQCGSEPVVSAGVPTGLESCSDGFVHRPAIIPACTVRLPRNVQCPNGDCVTDADCTARAFGFCNTEFPNCQCTYGCVNDADCTKGAEVCVCGDPVGTCVAAGCVSDADCEDGFCTAVKDELSGELFDFACSLPGNECEIDADCGTEACVSSIGSIGRECSSSTSGCLYGN